MDTILRKMIAAEVHNAMQTIIQESSERWLTPEQLTNQFGFFTKSWLKSYGHTLPRTQAIVTDSAGVEHKTGWCYPQSKIQKMILEGSIKHLTVKPINT